MQYLDLTLTTPAENLALDEALLDEAEQADEPTETLRLWEPAGPMVVLGRSSKAAEEVDRDACGRLDVPVLRRVSGGAAIVAGPGCLMYALVLSYRLRPTLRAVDHAHRFVLGTMAAALEPLLSGIGCQGTSDLAIGDLTINETLKFSGNSVRIKRDNFLYHGTLLYDFDLKLIDACLAMPPRQPDYRRGRSHADFVTNLPLEVSAIRRSLVAAWDAVKLRAIWPEAQTARLVAEKYSRPQWNEQP